jgi:hypothetical protein
LLPIEAEVQVLEHINADINPRLSRPDYGRYRRLLAPGSYTLRFLKDDYFTQTIGNVIVTSGSPTELDVLLEPVNPEPVPTLSEWGVIIMALILLAFATVAIIRGYREAYGSSRCS